MENKLSEEDQLVLSKLIDPDQQTQAKYPFGEEFQRVILGMLLCNRFFLSQSLGLIEPSYFVSEYHQLTCRVLFGYFEKYRAIPSKVFVKQLIDNNLQNKYKGRPETYQTSCLLYLGELNTVYDYYTKGGVGNIMPDLDSTDAILDQITAFAKSNAMRAAFNKSLNLIKKDPESDDTWNEVNEVIKKAQLVNRQFNIGLDYFQTIEDRYARMEENEKTVDCFTMGFSKIDRSLNKGGLLRGELGAWMGTPGSGKSLALTWTALKNVQQGHKVLYISTEMDQDAIATRFDAQMSVIGQHELLPRKLEVWKVLREQVEDYENKQRLIIKQFPSGSIGMNDVRAFHSQLVMMGFKPDLMIYDYPGDFKESSAVSGWENRFRLLREIRGFGVEEGHGSMIAVHPNRFASELGIDEFMDESKQGDSFKQFQAVDVFYTLNQTSREQKAAVGRVFVAKQRDGKSRFSFFIQYGFKDQTLTLKEVSEDKYRLECSRVTDNDAEETEMDKVDKVVGNKFVPSEGEKLLSED